MTYFDYYIIITLYLINNANLNNYFNLCRDSAQDYVLVDVFQCLKTEMKALY